MSIEKTEIDNLQYFAQSSQVYMVEKKQQFF